MNLRFGPRFGPCSRGRPPFDDPAGAVRASARRALGPCRLSRSAVPPPLKDFDVLLDPRIIPTCETPAPDGLFVVLYAGVFHPRRPPTRGLLLGGSPARTAAGRLDAALTLRRALARDRLLWLGLGAIGKGDAESEKLRLDGIRVLRGRGVAVRTGLCERLRGALELVAGLVAQLRNVGLERSDPLLDRPPAPLPIERVLQLAPQLRGGLLRAVLYQIVDHLSDRDLPFIHPALELLAGVDRLGGGRLLRPLVLSRSSRCVLLDELLENLVRLFRVGREQVGGWVGYYFGGHLASRCRVKVPSSHSVIEPHFGHFMAW